MSTTAVTHDASAAPETERQSELSQHSTILPTDKHYRLTGERTPPADTQDAPAAPAKDQPDKEPADITDASAASDSETAAASEAAQAQERKGKTAQTSENRYQKITRENRELREKLARMEGAASAREPQRDTQQTSQPAAEAKPGTRPEPKTTDTDPKTGQPKYKTWQEYQNDLRAWDREQAVAEFQKTSEKTAKERELEQAKLTIQKTVNERVAKARKDYPDYQDVMDTAIAAKNEHGQDLILITEGSPVDLFLLDSPRGQDVFYEIAKNLDDHAHIFARDAKGEFLLSPVRQLRELGKIENALPEAGSARTSTTTSPATPVTQAPRPPNQVSGKGTVAKDAVEQAVANNDTETYMKEQNARALARLKKK